MWKAIRARVFFYTVVYVGGTSLFLFLAYKLGWWQMLFAP